MTTYLVQNIETFQTIITFKSEDAFDTWMTDNGEYGIVSLDTDADGQYDFVALVAPVDGPDFDAVTQEPMNEASQEEILAAIQAEESPAPTPVEEPAATITTPVAPTPKKVRKSRKSNNTQSNTQSKGKTMKNHEILAAFISANPNVTRETIFNDSGLQGQLRNPAQVTAIAAGDTQEIKRWNSCINRFVRKIRRDGIDIQVNGQGKSATFLIGSPSGQLELPFTPAAEARNATIIGDDADEVVEAPKVDTKRAEEAPNQMVSFESLLAQLDEDEATITSDDQVAFKAAQEMIK